MKNTALLVVDVQHGFINQNTKHIPKLIEEILPKYETTIATRFFNPQNSNYRKLIHWNKFSAGSPEIDLAFTPKSTTLIIDKPIYTCINNDFLSYLDNKNITSIHIVGIDTDICVTKCAVDLFEADRTPYVLKNYCASHAGQVLHNAAIEILGRYIGKNQII